MAYLDKDSVIPEKGKGSKLGSMQERFIDEYLVDLNGAAAVRRAGYKTTNPNRIATRLLNHPLVQRELDTRQSKTREKLALSAEYVISKLIDITEMTAKDADKLRALELLGRHLGLYRDRQEISGVDGEAIQYQKVTEDAEEFTKNIMNLVERKHG
jgi:phage terminase small subunit